MTKAEAIRIVAMLETNWQPFKNSTAAVELWAAAFADDPYQLVNTAVMAMIQTDPCDFRPTVAKVRRKMHDIVYGERLSESEAWLAVKDSLHEAQEEPETLGGAKRAWAKLPEDLQKLVSPRQLLDWNSVDAAQLDTVIQSNFMRSYRDVTDRRYAKESISSGIAKQIGTIRRTAGVFRDPDEKPELPQPKRLAFEPPEWMVQRPDVRTGLEGMDNVRPVPIGELIL